MNIDALSAHTGVRLAEIGFLFILLAGAWLVVTEFAKTKLGSARTIGAGLALAISGVLLIVAVHWGQFA